MPAVLPTHAEIEALVDRALSEDLSAGDLTTNAVIPPYLHGKAVIMSKATGVVAGLPVALLVFNRLDPGVQTRSLMRDGDRVEPESFVAEVEGPVASILKAERTALNFLQRLSGIATEASLYAAAVEGHPARVLDTRKTTPGLRALEKYSVAVGGGRNHRHNLGDGILIKDNHLEAARRMGYGIAHAVESARASAPHTVKVEIEVEDLGQVREALDAGADILLLDNMGLDDMRAAVEMARGRAVIEASGGITLDNVRDVAATGVDFISVGALTHSPRALDMSLELVG